MEERANGESRHPRQIRTVVFDLGGVFFDWDPRHLYRKLIPDPLARERFLEEVCSPEWHAEQDLGRSVHEACADLAAKNPEYADLIRAWADRNEEMIAGVFEGTVDILRELRLASVPCYALSNMEAETFAFRQRHYEFMALFDGFVISSHERVAKPSAAIFRRLLERYGLDPRESLFVDDRVANIEAARQVGFDVCLFSSPDDLRGAIVARRLIEKGEKT